MTDQSMPPTSMRPQRVTRRVAAPTQPEERQVMPTPRATRQVAAPAVEQREAEVKLGLWATLDKPLLVIVGLLMVIGSMMVFSTTFNWSLIERGSSTAIFVQDHLRNVALGLGALVFFAVVDYRFWKRFSPLLLLFTLAALIAVLTFGDIVFNARRSLIGGRFQPSELAEFTTVFYMAAWLSARNTRVNSFVFGLIPFGVLVTLLVMPIALQPDLSSAVVIVLTAVMMYFAAGARLWHLGLAFGGALFAGVFLIQSNDYAQIRVDNYLSGLSDPTQAGYHTQQAITAFVNGGWFGKGLGQGTQKFNNALPAPHTDSIFAVIGEELGVVGAALVVLLFIAFVIRGFQIARRSVDPFGALLSIGFTLWVAIQALLNIAVMTNLIPSSGLPLPFISYGGSALLVLLIGVGLMLNVSRVATIRQTTARRRRSSATDDWGWGNRRARLSGTGRSRSATQIRRT